MNAKLNRKERKAQQLLAHYATCERLGAYLGLPSPDGKHISVALWKAEQLASKAAAAYCNGEIGEDLWSESCRAVKALIVKALGKLPPGFFINQDPMRYALCIDHTDPNGKAMIQACGIHVGAGQDGILSPEINGN